MLSSPFRLESFLPYRLNRVAAIASLRFRRLYADRFALTTPEWRVLATIGQFGESTARDIGRHSQMHKTKVSRAVRGLAERRWIVRRQNSRDRREEILALTTPGRRAYESLIPDMLALERALFDQLGPVIAAELDASLLRLEARLGIVS